MSFAGQTARWPFEKIPPHFIQLLFFFDIESWFSFDVKMAV